MTWHRLGRVFCPDNQFPWMASHAANPFAEHLGGSLFRIYFSCRDGARRSSVGALVFDIEKLSVLEIDSRPVLSFGPRGGFDDSGVSLGCIVADERNRYLYYVGWNLAVTVPFRNSIGLAISRDGGDFIKHSQAPILDRSRIDPFSLSYPWVLKEGPKWKMWYGSTIRWWDEGNEQDHVIKYAESSDGIEWKPTGHVCLGVLSESAYSLSRPCLLSEGGRYRMWFSYRGARYLLGCAESADGLHWRENNEDLGLAPGRADWESASVEYAHVFDHGSTRYVLYCGNGYGCTGFGIAVWR